MKIIFCMIAVALSASALGQDAETQFDNTFNDLAAGTRFSLVDAGGSKGTYGTTIGIGVSRTSLSGSSSYANAILGQPQPDGDPEAPRQWLRVSAMRGTSWPVDAGVSVSQLQGTQISQVSGVLQVTVFEELGWPAVSLRLHRSQILGLRQESSITSTAVECLATQGIWRYFTGYVGLGGEQTDLDLKVRNEETLSLNAAGELQDRRRIESYLLKGGLQISAWPPFVQVFGEYMTDIEQNQSLSLKLNWLI